MKHLWLCCFIVLTHVFGATAQPVFTVKPVDRQLYARDLVTNKATVRFTGSISGSDQYVIRRYRYPNGADLNGVGTFDADISLPASGGFDKTDQITAGLVNYRYQVFRIISPGNEVALGDVAREVVAGDAYLVYGQSNAEAGIFWQTGDPYIDVNSIYGSSFIRGIGRRVVDPPYDFSTWAVAEGEYFSDNSVAGSIGQWPLVLGRHIVNNQQIPVAFISYPRSGAALNTLTRNDANPTDQTTNYGRLLKKAIASGLKDKIRGFFFFQGEGDASAGRSVSDYKTLFSQFYADIKADFPGVTRTITFQIRPGGGITNNEALEIQQAQKEIADEMSDVEVISTNHIDHFSDNLHYGTNSYIECARRAYLLTKKFFYNQVISSNDVTPIVMQASRGEAGTIQVQLFPTDASYTVDANYKNYIRLEGTGAYSVSSVVMKGSILEVAFSKTGADPSTISFFGKEGSASPYLFNGTGIGLLATKSMSIQSALPVYFIRLGFSGNPDQPSIAWEVSENALFESFEIEASVDGRTWYFNTSIQAVRAATGIYSVLPLGSNAARFYRIRAVKYTGEPVYSPIIRKPGIQQENSWNIYPNPITDQSVIQYWSARKESIECQIVDIVGKTLILSKISVEPGMNLIPVGLPPSIRSGVYYLQIKTNGGVLSRKIVK